jgi:hypothetical protein
MTSLRTSLTAVGIALMTFATAGAQTPSTVKVAGSGVDDLTAAVIHSKKETQTGSVQQSTEIVELNGDLKGKVLYYVTTVIDSVHGTLVNTGENVYSGTVAGSAPVMIHDKQSRFDMNLRTGRDTGRVYMSHRLSGPRVKCKLDVVGTGMNAEGNPTFAYTGECIFANGRA